MPRRETRRRARGGLPPRMRSFPGPSSPASVAEKPLVALVGDSTTLLQLANVEAALAHTGAWWRVPSTTSGSQANCGPWRATAVSVPRRDPVEGEAAAWSLLRAIEIHEPRR